MKSFGWCFAFTLMFPLSAWADLSGTPTIQPTGSLDLDTGSVLSFPSEDVDIGWNGALHTEALVSGYLMPGVTGAAAFGALTQSSLTSLPYATNFSVRTPQLAVGVILAFKTKSGKFSKVLVTALTPADGSGSITLQFTTFGVGGSGNSVQPAVTSIVNNYSLIPQGAPNWGIAPGSVFIIQGTGLANATTPLESSAAPGLQTNLNGVSVQVQVVNTKVQCFLYYLSPTQIDAVLPSNTPGGAGTLTVTNGGATSAGTPITVVSTAFGILSYNGTLAAAYDASNALITPLNAANPGQTIALWGSGLGADLANDDHLFPQKQNNLAGSFLQAFLGGETAKILYAGRSQYPGLDQIVLTIPNNVTPGCFVSVVVVASQIMPSNFATIPIASSGKTCTDLGSPANAQLYPSISSQSAKVGVLSVIQSFGAATGTAAIAGFQRISGFGGTVGNGAVSVGSCIVTNSLLSPSTTTTGLDAGSAITLSGPAGSRVTLGPYTAPGVPGGTYATALASGFIPSGGGTLTFDNGNGGADVGHFSASLAFPGSFSWTNQAQVSTITPSLGVTVNWTGGNGGGFVGVSGSVGATLAGNSNNSVSFTCYVPVAAGSFTVPPAVLQAMPSGNGTLTVGVLSAPSAFTASGIDFGSAAGAIIYTQGVAYGGARR